MGFITKMTIETKEQAERIDLGCGKKLSDYSIHNFLHPKNKAICEKGSLCPICKIIFETQKKCVNNVLKLIKAWDGYGDDRFPEGEVKELVKEVKKLRSLK